MTNVHTETDSGRHANELMNIFHDLIYQDPVLSMLPEDRDRLRDLIDKMYPEGVPRRTETNSMMLRVGIQLTRASESMTITQLSEALDIPLSTTSRLSDWMEASGFAERWPDQEDRRVIRLSLTPSGAQLFHSIYGLLKRRMEWQIRTFSPEEREILVLLLRKLVAGGRQNR